MHSLEALHIDSASAKSASLNVHLLFHVVRGKFLVHFSLSMSRTKKAPITLRYRLC